jgi:hypothetical protein
MTRIITLFILLLATAAWSSEPTGENNDHSIDPSLIKIKVKREEADWKASIRPNLRLPTEEKEVYFNLFISNRNTVNLSNLSIDYCTYSDGSDQFRTTSQRKIIGDVNSGSTLNVKAFGGTSIRIDATGYTREIMGGRFRIYETTDTGKKLIKEVHF